MFGSDFPDFHSMMDMIHQAEHCYDCGKRLDMTKETRRCAKCKEAYEKSKEREKDD